jgi:hypothetical protein
LEGSFNLKTKQLIHLRDAIWLNINDRDWLDEMTNREVKDNLRGAEIEINHQIERCDLAKTGLNGEDQEVSLLINKKIKKG